MVICRKGTHQHHGNKICNQHHHYLKSRKQEIIFPPINPWCSEGNGKVHLCMWSWAGVGRASEENGSVLQGQPKQGQWLMEKKSKAIGK